MAKHEFHVYASTKTTAQLFLDLAAAFSHAITLYLLLKLQQRDLIRDILLWLVIVTVIVQGLLAVTLFALRLMAMSHDIPQRAKYLNNLAFWGCIFVALLEVGIAGIEKLGLDGHIESGKCNQSPPIVPS